MQNDMRDKLAELLEQAEGQVNNDVPSLEMIADYLIANDVDKVVRCKDCAKRLTRECALWYGTTANNGKTTDYFCAAGQLNENFYCAYGVKREAKQ